VLISVSLDPVRISLFHSVPNLRFARSSHKFPLPVPHPPPQAIYYRIRQCLASRTLLLGRLPLTSQVSESPATTGGPIAQPKPGGLIPSLVTYSLVEIRAGCSMALYSSSGNGNRIYSIETSFLICCTKYVSPSQLLNLETGPLLIESSADTSVATSNGSLRSPGGIVSRAPTSLRDTEPPVG
jgi:hypothetical protein